VQTREAALAAADHLSVALEENTSALKSVKRRYRLTLALLAIVALTLFVAIKVNYDATVDRCESGNELRADIDEKFAGTSTALRITIGGDPNELEEQFLDLLDDELPPRDCSDINWLGQ
jgi:hypothetical protein